MIEGKRVLITNPKTFLDGKMGAIVEKTRAGFYRIDLDDPDEPDVILMGNNFIITGEADQRQPNYD